MGFLVGEEVVLILKMGTMITRVKGRWLGKDKQWWLTLEEPQTGTLFQRKESQFTEGKRLPPLSPNGPG